MAQQRELQQPTPAEVARLRQAEAEGWGGLMGALLCLIAAGIFVYQIYLWLKTGLWVSMPISRLLTWLGFDLSFGGSLGWKGFQKIVLWLLAVPLSVFFVLFAFAVTYFLPIIFGSRINKH